MNIRPYNVLELIYSLPEEKDEEEPKAEIWREIGCWLCMLNVGLCLLGRVVLVCASTCAVVRVTTQLPAGDQTGSSSSTTTWADQVI